MVDFTQDLNTQIARQLGLIGTNQNAGGGAVSQALASNPGKVQQYTDMRKKYQPGYSYQAPQVQQTQQPQVSYQETGRTGVTESFTANPKDYTLNPTNNSYYLSNPMAMQRPGRTAKNQKSYGTVGLQNALHAYNTQPATPAAPPPAPAPTVAPQAPVAQPQEPQINPYQTFMQDLQNSLKNMELPENISPPEPVAPQINATLPEDSNLTGMDDMQRRAYLATQGVYGGGNDQNAADYFLSQIQQSATGGNFNLLPVEETYLQSLGLDAGSSDSFMKSLARYLSMMSEPTQSYL